MGLPRKLKLMNLITDGNEYHGQVNEVEQPKLALKLDEYRAGGMIGAVKINFGLETLETTLKMGGYMVEFVKMFGGEIDGVPLRLMGAYEQDDTGEVTSIEIVMRGRFGEIDSGSAKVGDDSEQSFTVPLTYYKVIENGNELLEIDMLNSIFKVNGQDRLEQHRAAVGLK